MTRRRLLDAVLRYAGTDVSMSAWRASDALAAALQSVAPVAALLTHDIEPLDESAAGLQLFVGADDVGRTLPHRLLFDNQTFATYLAYWGERRPDPLRVSITLAVEGTPVAYDLLGGSQAAAADFVRDAATRRVRASVPLTGGPMLARLQRRRGRRVRRAKRGARRAPVVRRRSDRAAPGAAARAGRAGAQLRRAGPHGAALPADDDRSGIRRRDREPLFRDRRRRRMGGALVLGERVDLGIGSAAVSAAAAREGAVAAAAAAVRRGLPLPAGRDGARRRLRLLRRAVRAAQGGRVAVYRHDLDRPQDVRADPGAGGAGRARRAGRLQRGDPALHAAGHGRESGGVSVQRPHRPADHADRGPEPPGREERDLHRFHRSTIPPSKMRARPPGRATT